MTRGAQEILEHLPHRPPFRFISDNIRFEGVDQATADWRVAGDEPILEGHFPGAPVVPGVLVGEALAQLSGLIVVRRLSSGEGAFSPQSGKLAHMDMRFPATIVPPATIQLSAALSRVFGNLWQFECVATCGGAPVARGTLALAISPDGSPSAKE